MGDDSNLSEQLRAILEGQPLYRKYAKTVTSVVGLLVNVVWLMTSAGIEVPQNITVGVAALIAILTTLGVYQVPNAVTEQQVKELESYVGRHRRD